MRICILTTYLALDENADSGIGQHYRILADTLAAQGHTVHLIYPTVDPHLATAAYKILSPRWTCEILAVKPSKWLQRLLTHSWPSQLLLRDFYMAWVADRALRRAALEHSLEIVETHATGAPAVRYLLRRHRLPVVTRISTTMSQMNATSNIHSRVKNWQAAIERFAVRASDSLVTHTARHRDTICHLDGYQPEKITLIPHGLPDKASASGGKVGAAYIEILYVGRFEPRKGIDVLLEAIPPVLTKHPNVIFTLAGSIGDGLIWSKFVREHNNLVGTQVISLGNVTVADLEVLYDRCDIVVAPSRYESFGLIYVEAMRRSKPTIGCNAGGIPEVITDGVTGLLAQPGEVNSLVVCLERLISDADYRAKLGAAGRADFLHRFSAAEMTTRSVDHYQNVLANRGSQPSPTK